MWLNNKGYPCFTLNWNGCKKNVLAHRMMASTFLGDNPNLEACHRDGNPLNSRLPNIRWDTSAGNKADKATHGTDHNRNKEVCPRKHHLSWPNLVNSQAIKGHRTCKACARARSHAQRRSEPFSLEIADMYYERILSEKVV